MSTLAERNRQLLGLSTAEDKKLIESSYFNEKILTEEFNRENYEILEFENDLDLEPVEDDETLYALNESVFELVFEEDLVQNKVEEMTKLGRKVGKLLESGRNNVSNNDLEALKSVNNGLTAQFINEKVNKWDEKKLLEFVDGKIERLEKIGEGFKKKVLTEEIEGEDYVTSILNYPDIRQAITTAGLNWRKQRDPEQLAFDAADAASIYIYDYNDDTDRIHGLRNLLSQNNFKPAPGTDSREKLEYGGRKIYDALVKLFEAPSGSELNEEDNENYNGIETVFELYEKYGNEYPYATDAIAYYIFGKKSDDNILVKAYKGAYGRGSEIDSSEISSYMMDNEYSWEDSIEDINEYIKNLTTRDGSFLKDYF